MGNNFMQSLALKHFLVVKILSVFCIPFSHADLNDPGSRATATTKMELFDQVTLCVYFGNEDYCTGSRGKSFAQSIAILKKRIIVSVV